MYGTSFNQKEIVLFDDHDDRKDYRHTVTLVYIPFLNTFKIKEWYLNGIGNEYSKESIITDETQKQIYKAMFESKE